MYVQHIYIQIFYVQNAHAQIRIQVHFENTHTEVLVESTTANRAHFHLRDDVIYVTYDEVQDGSLNVYALTVEISR